MRDGIEPTSIRNARIVIWLALSVALLSYLRWGSEIVSTSRFLQTRRSVPSIWNTFYRGLPEIANGAMLDIVYSTALAAVIVGTLALFWLALIPGEDEAASPDADQPAA